MSAIRRVARMEAVRTLLCRLAATYIKLVRMSGRWTLENDAYIRDRVAKGQPLIACFWHGRMLMMPHAWPFEREIKVLISQHPDGRFIARTMSYFGFGTITGSSSKGGSTALRAMVRELNEDGCIVVTPDGPRGPRMRASVGIARAAKLAQVPIIPVSFGVSRQRILGSWDRMILPLPFSRGIIRFADPIHVPADADNSIIEQKRRAVEDALNALANDLDDEFGHERIAPATADEAPKGRATVSAPPQMDASSAAGGRP